jgi:hypothetical protein
MIQNQSTKSNLNINTTQIQIVFSSLTSTSVSTTERPSSGPRLASSGAKRETNKREDRERERKAATTRATGLSQKETAC